MPARVDFSALAPARPGLGVWVALATVYLVWGSTYLAIKVALESFAPLFMCAVRFLVAGGVLYGALRLLGHAAPTRDESRAAAIMAAFLLVGGTGCVVLAEQWVDSGMTALIVAATPLWTALFAALRGGWPTRREGLGLVVGFLGVASLHLDANLAVRPLGAGLLLVASSSWAYGSLLGSTLSLPRGLMAPAVEMLWGGLYLAGMSLVFEPLPAAWPTGRAAAALAYLASFGSIAAFSAYLYLLAHARPALASSYAYVNPVVALALGWGLAGEPIAPGTGWAALLVVVGVVLVVGAGTGAPKLSQTGPGADT